MLLRSVSLFRNENISLNQINNKTKVSFTGIPYSLPEMPVTSGEDAVSIFGYFSLGNYLDSNDDDICPNNKKIREKNLRFLDKLYTQRDKQIFVDYYKRLTGFPDLKNISEKIENQFYSAVMKSSSKNRDDEFYCIAAGYDESCSVGKRKAWPGSDLDKAFVVIRGSNNAERNIEIVNEFKRRLWENTDQRILSYNHDTSFPNVYTVKQIKDLINKINISTVREPLNRTRLRENLKECFDLERAGEYNIQIAKYFPLRPNVKDPSELTKENVKNFAFFIESLKDGKAIINTPEFQQLKYSIEDSDFYQYSNVAHIKGMKDMLKSGKGGKRKLRLREEIQTNFNNWDTNRQFNFIKVLIKASCEDNESESSYFTNEIDMKQRYKDFLAVLTKGAANFLFQPEFREKDGALVMKYAKNKDVNLYVGHSDKILWVDDIGNEDAVIESIRQIDKIKLVDRFKNVSVIQYPAYYSNIDGFSKTSFYTSSGIPIYGKKI